MRERGVAPLVIVFWGVGAVFILAGLMIMAESTRGAADDILVIAGLGLVFVGSIGW